MGISHLFQSGLQQNNRIHFAAIVKIAMCDGAINESEKQALLKLAEKLDINEDTFSEIICHVDESPMPTVTDKNERLEYIYDFFKIIVADNEINELELKFAKKYAIGLGFKEDEAKKIIDRTSRLLGGHIDFEDYNYLLTKK